MKKNHFFPLPPGSAKNADPKHCKKENPLEIIFKLKKRIFIPCYITVQKLYYPYQSVVSKQTLEMPKKILSCKRVASEKTFLFKISFRIMKMKTPIDNSQTPADNTTPNSDFVVMTPIMAKRNNRRM